MAWFPNHLCGLCLKKSCLCPAAVHLSEDQRGWRQTRVGTACLPLPVCGGRGHEQEQCTGAHAHSRGGRKMAAISIDRHGHGLAERTWVGQLPDCDWIYAPAYTSLLLLQVHPALSPRTYNPLTVAGLQLYGYGLMGSNGLRVVGQVVDGPFCYTAGACHSLAPFWAWVWAPPVYLQL
jgi:hypothetical protein